MTLSANFTSKSVFDQQVCRALTFALAIGFLVCIGGVTAIVAGFVQLIQLVQYNPSVYTRWDYIVPIVLIVRIQPLAVI